MSQHERTTHTAPELITIQGALEVGAKIPDGLSADQELAWASWELFGLSDDAMSKTTAGRRAAPYGPIRFTCLDATELLATIEAKRHGERFKVETDSGTVVVDGQAGPDGGHQCPQRRRFSIIFDESGAYHPHSLPASGWAVVDLNPWRRVVTFHHHFRDAFSWGCRSRVKAGE